MRKKGADEVVVREERWVRKQWKRKEKRRSCRKEKEKVKEQKEDGGWIE